MSYKRGYDPTPIETKPRPLLTLTNPVGVILFKGVKSYRLRYYFRDMYGEGSNGKKVWRAGLEKLGYKIEKS